MGRFNATAEAAVRHASAGDHAAAGIAAPMKALVAALALSLLVSIAPAARAQPVSAAAAPFIEQARAQGQAGNFPGELEALERGVATLGERNPDAEALLRELMQYHTDRGNSVSALRAVELQLALPLRPGARIARLAALSQLRSVLRDRAGAEDAIRQLRTTQWPPNEALQFRLYAQLMTARANGLLASNFGQFDAAEAAYAACLALLPQFYPNQPYVGVLDVSAFDCAAGATLALIQQGKLAEAGAVLAGQKVALDKLAQSRPTLRNRLAAATVRVALEQGRNDEARRLGRQALDALLSSNAEDSSIRVSLLRLQLAQADMLDERWADALAQHEARSAAASKADNKRATRGLRSVEHVYTLIRAGRAKDAEAMSGDMLEFTQRTFDADSVYLWEVRAFHGIAQAASGKQEEALQQLSAAVPRLLKLAHAQRSSAESGVLRTARLNWVIDGYLALLSEIARSGGPKAQEAIDESFRLADIARGSTVQRALGAAATRGTPNDPALAETARREQDQRNEMSALADALANLLSRGRVTEQDKVVTDMRNRLTQLRGEHDKTMRELQRRFPAYGELLDPQPVAPAQIQKVLAPNEAMLAFYTVADRTLVWAVPATGPARFAVSTMGAAEVAKVVAALRRTLDPGAAAIPRFDTDAAYQLYKNLLEPVAAGWKDASKLIIVPHGQLGQVPFSVLLTEPWRENTSGGLPFSSMANAPWLIKRVAISQLPAAVALPALRLRKSASAPKAFIGFGDPLFSSEQVALSDNAGPQRRNLAIKPAKVASVAAAEVGTPIDFSLLSPLPDTALEINEIAQALKADLKSDAFLQQRATETNVRAARLSDYRVVMFATHGLVPGEMPGLFQPALALSNPALSGEPAAAGLDGMLTMDKILSLKLNADWVVLSACNTASSSGRGSEAVSGLGRAFFYAGAKSLLVTHWPVETVSARLLTTDAFRRQADDPKASRAGLMQEAALSLMKKNAPNYSYAHPMFWAPYIIVGDGG